MYKFCSDCRNFNTNKVKVSGCCYCSKCKDYVWANMDSCDQFEKTYMRNSIESQRLCDKARESQNKSDDSNLLPLAIFLTLLLIICKIFNII